MSGGYHGYIGYAKVICETFQSFKDNRKCSSQELDSLVAVLKVGLSKAVKCLISMISVVWNLGGLLINSANKQCLK